MRGVGDAGRNGDSSSRWSESQSRNARLSSVTSPPNVTTACPSGSSSNETAAIARTGTARLRVSKTRAKMVSPAATLETIAVISRSVASSRFLRASSAAPCRACASFRVTTATTKRRKSATSVETAGRRSAKLIGTR